MTILCVQEKEWQMKNWDRGKAYMYALIGAYLLYLAYQLFSRLGVGEANTVVVVIFAVLFLIIGVLLLGYVLYMYFKFKKNPARDEESDQEKQADIAEEVEKLPEDTEILKDSEDTGKDQGPE